jgi:hypothetical protein
LECIRACFGTFAFHSEVEPNDFRKHVIDFARRCPYKIDLVFPETCGLFLCKSAGKPHRVQ